MFAYYRNWTEYCHLSVAISVIEVLRERVLHVD